MLSGLFGFSRKPGMAFPRPDRILRSSRLSQETSLGKLKPLRPEERECANATSAPLQHGFPFTEAHPTT